MKRLSVLTFVVLVALSCVNSTHADDASLASELSSLREAWLYGDADTAAARLDTLREDDRLGGMLPRWYAFMRAWLALDAGDDDAAREALRPILDESRDARNFVRACRLYLAMDRAEAAEVVIDEGLTRAPESPALLRFKAGLQWLRGDNNGALETYLELLCADDRSNYPWVSPHRGTWMNATPWPDPDDEGDSPEDAEDEEENGETDVRPEPQVSLFEPQDWYTTDLPGLARCIEDLASDEAAVDVRASRLEQRVETAEEYQLAVTEYRGGDGEARAELERRAVRASWLARLDAHVVAEAHLSAGRNEEAVAVAARGLELTRDDVALLDAQARAFGQLGLAEDARTGPLARLQSAADLSMELAGDEPDRILTPALTLYRANPEAGKRQFEEIRRSFVRGSNTPTHPGLVGVWLSRKGENELARRYLLEASRFDGHDSGRPLYRDALAYEVALLAIGDDADSEEDDEIEQPEGDDDVESVAMADVEDAHPLIRKALRVGGIMGSWHDTRDMYRRFADVDLYGGSAGMGAVLSAAKLIPDGERVVYNALHRMAEVIAGEVPADEINRWLGDDSAISRTLADTLDSMGESLGQYRSSGNWRLRQVLAQQAGPVVGMVEARSILLRAKLRIDAPEGLDALGKWMEEQQVAIDLRHRFQMEPDDDYTRAKDAREQAGLPEIVHKGLLVDAAQMLARGGNPETAARLIWHNRGAMLGMESRAHLIALAGVLARKGGNDDLAVRCRIEVAGIGNNRSFGRDGLFELPLVRENLIEFGNAQDVVRYLESAFVPSSSSDELPLVLQRVPEAREARPTLFMMNPGRVGVDGIFGQSIKSSSAAGIERNWNKLLLSESMRRPARRLAAWLIVSDLALYVHNDAYTGCNHAADAIRGWELLHALYGKTGEDGRAAKLAGLISRLGGEVDEDQPDRYWE